MIRTIAALALSLAASQALSYPILDFEGIPEGPVGDWYNGAGGPNYGIHFTGGQVKHGPNGAYLVGGTTLTFAPHADLQQIAFQATRTDDEGGFSYVGGANGVIDAAWINGVQNPMCRNLTAEECLRRGYSYIPPDRLFDASMHGGGGPLASAAWVRFDTSLLDNISFLSPAWSALADPPAGQVPLPGTAWLMSVGLLALLAGRTYQYAKIRQ